MALKLSKVLISDEVDQLCVTVLKDNGIEVVKNTKLTKEQLIAEIPVRQVILVCCNFSRMFIINYYAERTVF